LVIATAVAMTAVAPLVVAPAAADQGISRDLGFGTAGRVTVLDQPSGAGGYFSVTTQQNGKILVAVSAAPTEKFVRRYLPTGALDQTFGDHGQITMPIDLMSTILPVSATGPIFALSATATEDVYELRRFGSDGAPDVGFGTNGVAQISAPGFDSTVTLVADSSGRVTVDVVKHALVDTTRLQRFTAAGQPDNSFGVGSVSVLDDTLGNLAGFDTNGRLLLTAFKSGAFVPSIARVTVGGLLDPTYGTLGYASLEDSVDNPVLLVNSDSSVVVAGRGFLLTDGTIHIQKLTPAGTTDSSFGTAGIKRISFLDLEPGVSGITDAPMRLMDRGSGRIGLLGNSVFPAAAVMSANGTLDTAFGEGGRAIISSTGMMAGSFGPNDSIDFLGSDAIRPVFLQHSVDGSPWPPVSPAPTNLVVTATDGIVIATWSPVTNPDPEVVDYGYIFDISPDPFPSSQQTVTTTKAGVGIVPPGTYTVTIRSVNKYTAGLPATATVVVPVPVTPPPPSPPPPPPPSPPPPSAGPTTTYAPLVPRRLLDTRPGQATFDGVFGGMGLRARGSVTQLPIANRAAVAATATAVVLNVTVTEPTAAGFITVYPCSSKRPTASNINFVAGETIANAVVARLDVDGTVCFFTSAPTHLVVDVNGYFPPAASYAPLVPGRLLDTRLGQETADGLFSGIGPRPAGTVTELSTTSRAGVETGAAAAIVNVTVTQPFAAGFVTVYPCGTPRPTASNINFVAGETIANAVVAMIGAEGRICLFNSAPTHLVVDVNGYFLPGSPYAPLVPVRLLDSRPEQPTGDGQFAGIGQRDAGSVTELPIAERAGIAADASAVILNVTVTEPVTAGFVTVYPCGLERPLASSLNFVAGQTVANAVVATVGGNGKVCLYTSTSTHLVADVNGYFRRGL